MFGAGAGEDVDLEHQLAQFLFTHQCQLGTGQGGFADADAQLRGDDACGFGVVAGDHLHLDAGSVTFGNRGDGFLAGRVDDADQCKQTEAGLHVRKIQSFLAGRCRS